MTIDDMTGLTELATVSKLRTLTDAGNKTILMANLVVLAAFIIGFYFFRKKEWDIDQWIKKLIPARPQDVKREEIPEEARKNGFLMAEVFGITRGVRMEGDRETYYVVCRYKDPESGRELTYTSRELLEYPGKDIIGKKVRVVFQSNEPGDYRIELG